MGRLWRRRLRPLRRAARSRPSPAQRPLVHQWPSRLRPLQGPHRRQRDLPRPQARKRKSPRLLRRLLLRRRLQRPHHRHHRKIVRLQRRSCDESSPSRPRAGWFASSARAPSTSQASSASSAALRSRTLHPRGWSNQNPNPLPRRLPRLLHRLRQAPRRLHRRPPPLRRRPQRRRPHRCLHLRRSLLLPLAPPRLPLSRDLRLHQPRSRSQRPLRLPSRRLRLLRRQLKPPRLSQPRRLPRLSKSRLQSFPSSRGW